MRSFALLLLLGLSGCGVPWTAPAGSFVAADAATVPVLGRGIGDAVYSTVTGKDCSIVRLDQGKTYCKKIAPPPARPPFCTRSLGTIDCWSNPDGLNGPPRHGVADGPTTLTPEQEANRTARWPPL
jgi:hypothetical protein